MATYGGEIEPMTDKSQWPQVHLPFVVGAPLAKRNVGRQRKLRIKGCLEGVTRKKVPMIVPMMAALLPRMLRGRK